MTPDQASTPGTSGEGGFFPAGDSRIGTLRFQALQVGVPLAFAGPLAAWWFLGHFAWSFSLGTGLGLGNFLLLTTQIGQARKSASALMKYVLFSFAKVLVLIGLCYLLARQGTSIAGLVGGLFASQILIAGVCFRALSPQRPAEGDHARS